MPPTTQDETTRDDLAENSQAGSVGQTSDGLEWKEKYVGLAGKLKDIQTRLTDAEAKLAEREAVWTTEKKDLVVKTGELQSALDAAQSQMAEITQKWTSASTQAQELATRMERQEVLLKHPNLISEPVLKLVSNSNLSADELAETLAALGASQKSAIDASIQDVRSGATPPVGGTAGTGTTKKEQATEAWNAATAAMKKGDLAGYREYYAQYLKFADESGISRLSVPTELSSSNPI